METLHDAIAKLKSSAPGPLLVADWENYIPAGSRWRPGDLGDPACPHCHGIGYVSAGVAVGHPLFGKLYVCECAEARLSAAQSSRIQSASEMSAEELALGWSNVVASGSVGLALSALRATVKDRYGWCYLWGPPGPGKTLMLKVAVAECLRAGQAAVFVEWADLLQHLRGGYDASNYDERVDRWRNVPVLAVDEFGRAKESEWVREAQARIFNYRYKSAVERRTLTLFASNFAPEHSDEWFADRVRDGRFKVVQVTEPSMRPMME